MKEKIVRFLKYIFNIQFLHTLSTILLSIGCAYVSGYNFNYENVQNIWDALWLVFNPYVLIIVGSGILIFASYKQYIQTSNLVKSIDSLNKENESLKESNRQLISEKEQYHKSLEKSQEECALLNIDIIQARRTQVENWLKGLFKQFSLTTYDRISIYCVVDNSFYLVNRYSDNPSLCRNTISKIANLENKYPMEKGVIYKAWCHNKHYDSNCPAYIEDEEGYYSHMSREYGYDREYIAKINMKSCRYLGLAIKEQGNNIGVIIFESTNKNNISKSAIAKIEAYCKDYNDYLCGFIEFHINNIGIDNARRNSTSSNDAQIYEELMRGKQ